MKVFKATTKKERNGKKNWLEIGTFFENDQGQISGYLNNNPDVNVYLFEQKPKQNNHPAQQNQGQQPNIQFDGSGSNPDNNIDNSEVPF